MSLCGYEDEIDWRESLEPETFTVLNMPLYLLEFGTLMISNQQFFRLSIFFLVLLEFVFYKLLHFE